MSANNLTALEEKNAEDGNGIGSAPSGYDGDSVDVPDYMHATDPTIREVSPDAGPTLGGESGLDLLRKRTTARVTRKVAIQVPDREGVAIQMEAYIEASEMREWTKHSRLSKNRPASDDNVDGVLLGARALAAKATGIIIDGQTIIDADSGDNLTFLDESIKATYGTRTPWDAVKALVGTDPGVLSMFQALMEESGYANSADVTSGN